MGTEWNNDEREPQNENAQSQTPGTTGQQNQQSEFAQGGQQSQFDREQSGQQGFSDQQTQGNQGSFSGGSEAAERSADSDTLTDESSDLGTTSSGEGLGQSGQDSGFIGSESSGSDDYLQEDTKSDFAERDSLNTENDDGMGSSSSEDEGI